MGDRSLVFTSAVYGPGFFGSEVMVATLNAVGSLSFVMEQFTS